MRALGIAAVLTAVLTVYLPHAWQASFVYEDHQVLNAGGGFPGWRLVFTSGRGLTRETWRHVQTPQAAHALNLALHLMVVALTGALFYQVTGRVAVGLAVAGVVALHPLSLEGVAYASSRAELVAACGALLVLVAVTARQTVATALMPVGLLVAYAGKETGLVVLGLMPLMLWLQGSRLAARQLGWALVGAGALVWLALAPRLDALLTMGFTARVPHYTALEWMLMQAAAVYRLIVLSVAPFWLSVNPNITGPSWAGVAALILLAGLCEVAWRCRQRAPMFFAGIVWCAVVAAPRFLIRTPLSPFNEHQWYLAIVGVALVIVAGIETLDARWRQWEMA